MKKLFLIPLLTLFTCVNAWGTHVDVSDASSLTTELAKENPADTINVTANCTLTVSTDFKNRVIKTANNKRLKFAPTNSATFQNFVFNPVNFGAHVQGNVIFENADLGPVNLTTSAASNLTLQGNISLPIFNVSYNSSITNKTNVSVAVTGTKDLTLTNESGATFTFKSTTDFGGDNLTINGTGSIAIEPGAQFKKSAWDGCSALATYCTNNNLYPEPWAVSGNAYVKVFAAEQDHVAKIGDDEYLTLDAAVAAASANDTIDLTDYAVNEAEVKISKNLTINGGTGACKTLDCYFNITGANTLKLINVAVEPTAGSYAVQLIKDSKLILSNAHVKGRSGNSAIKVSTSTANTTCQIESEANTSNSIKNTASSSSYTINGNRCEVEFMGSGDLLVEHKGTSGYLFGGTNGKFKLNAPNAIYTYETASCNVKNTATDAVNHLRGIYSTVIESYEEGGHTVYPVANANQLKIALKVASDNDVIRLNEGLIALTEQVVIDKTLTIDFRGCRLYSENMMNIDNLIKVGKDASSTNTVTFMSSGALEGGIYTYSLNAAAIEVYSNAIFERGLIENKHSYYTTIDADHIELLNCHALRLHSGANVTINGGTFKSQRYAVYAKGDDASKDINLTINGGEFQVVNNPRNNAAAVAVVGNTETETAYNATVTINGGTFSGAYSGVNVLGKGAVLNVIDGTIDGNAVAIAGNGSEGNGDTEINISGGTIGSETTPVGIYHPQAGELNISGGTVTGLTAVAMKSGSLAMTDGTLRSTGEGTRVPGYNNGTYASAAALQIESNPSYAGSMDINISGGKLESNSWYAVYEYTPEAQNPTLATEVNSIAISGGAHIGGILLSQSLAAKGGFVSGGKWTKDISANIKTGENLSLLNNEDDDNPPYLYLVGVPAPAQAEDYAEKDANNNAVLTNAASQSAAASYSSNNVGNDPDVIATKETTPVVVSENTDVVATEAAPVVEVKKVTVDNNAQLTVTEGATLVVGAGAVTLDKTSSNGLTVEAGATLVVDGLIYGSTEDNFVIESQEGKSGIVLFSPETEFIREDHPKATYRFTSKAFWSQAESKWVYQRFGVPTFDGHATLQWLNNPGGGVNSWVKKWDYENDDWTSWTAFTADQLEINDAIPFQGLMLASDNVKPDNTNPAMIYEFTGSLMGNSDANLHFYYGWNYYANSYTAPININEFIQTVKTSLGGSNDILATIYLYQDLGNDTYTWQAVNEFTAGSSTVVGFAPGVGPIYENVPSVINPMQAFLMRLNVEGEADQTIDYADNVYTPATTNTFNPAPARNRVTNNSMQISVFNANGNFDKVFFVENDNFSNDLDNGFDAYKYDGNKGVSLYAMSADKHMEILASNDVDGSFIGINAPEAGNYTLYFSGIQGMNYALIDMTNNTVVTIEEGGQFNFYAEAGQNDYRFQLVAPARVPTAVENVGAKADVKGVYTITGQYLGEDINALPKGVYIINGAKVVK